MKIFLKKIISSNVLLYYFWFKTVRSRKGLEVSFFKRSTELYLDGYPRSGNTFAIHLLRNILPDLNTVHHLHVVAAIKIALILKIPTVILIRDPLNAISSKYLKHFSMRDKEVDLNINQSLLNLFIEDYLNYYRFVLKKDDEIMILDFYDLIEAPYETIMHIKKRISSNTRLNDEDIDKVISSYKSATNTMGSSRPNETKEAYKDVIKEHLRNSNKYTDLQILYDKVLNLSDKI